MTPPAPYGASLFLLRGVRGLDELSLGRTPSETPNEVGCPILKTERRS
jgi:hypothetical protein